jgi:hypothetical protein
MRKLILWLCVICAVFVSSPSIAEQVPLRDTYVFETFTCSDSQSGIQAFSILKPSDWKVTGDVTWTLDTSPPAGIGLKLASADGSLSFELLPPSSFAWSDNIIEKESTEKTIRLAPMDASEYLENYLLPLQLKNEKYSIIETVALPDLSDLVSEMKAKSKLPDSSTLTVTSARSTVEYILNDLTVREDFYSVITRIDTNLQTLDGVQTTTDWTAEQQFRFRYPASDYKLKRSFFVSIIQSLLVNPDWFSIVEQVTDTKDSTQPVDIKRLRPDVGNDTIDKVYMLLDVFDYISDDFSDFTSCTSAVKDPYLNATIELPSGYDFIWTDKNGKYLLTSLAGYDPNSDESLDKGSIWVQMQISGIK